MNKTFIPVLALICGLVACGGGDTSTQKQEETRGEGVDALLKAEVQGSITPKELLLVSLRDDSGPYVKSVKIYGTDSLVICRKDKDYTYLIDKERSSERTHHMYYQWVFALARKDNSAPEYKQFVIPQYMDDVYGELKFRKFLDGYEDACILVAPNNETLRFAMSNVVDLERNMFVNHPKAPSFPEMEFKVGPFHPFSGVDLSNVPSFWKSAETIVLKGDRLILRGKDSSVDLDIVPLSDYETCGGEIYEWYFTVRKEGLSYTFTISSSSPDEIPCVPTQGEFIDSNTLRLLVGSWGDYEVKSVGNCGNFKRGICTSYPTDEEYNNWVNPDVDDYY